MQKIIMMLSLPLLMMGFMAEAPKTAVKSGTPIMAILTGSAEVPRPGDLDGSGMAIITLNQGQGEITYELTADGIATPLAAHIHMGAAGTNGPVVVHLDPPVGGNSSGVVSVDPELIKMIRKNPENFYVNVHNSQFPSGAIRGQLMK